MHKISFQLAADWVLQEETTKNRKKPFMPFCLYWPLYYCCWHGPRTTIKGFCYKSWCHIIKIGCIYTLLRENGKKKKKLQRPAQSWLLHSVGQYQYVLSKKLHCNIAKKKIQSSKGFLFKSVQFILAGSGLVRTRFNVLAK